MTFVNSNGVRIYYEVVGQGSPLSVHMRSGLTSQNPFSMVDSGIQIFVTLPDLEGVDPEYSAWK